jgi:hypothetical protein
MNFDPEHFNLIQIFNQRPPLFDFRTRKSKHDKTLQNRKIIA